MQGVTLATSYRRVLPPVFGKTAATVSSTLPAFLLRLLFTAASSSLTAKRKLAMEYNAIFKTD